MPAVTSNTSKQKVALEAVMEESLQRLDHSESGPFSLPMSPEEHIISLQADVSDLSTTKTGLQQDIKWYEEMNDNLRYSIKRTHAAAMAKLSESRAATKQAQRELDDYKQGINTLAEATTSGVREEIAGLRAMLEAQNEQYARDKEEAAATAAAKDKKRGLRQSVVGCFKG